MFRRRKLKKEASKSRIKILFLSTVVLLVLILCAEFMWLNFSFGKTILLSPIAGNNKSALSLLENQLYAKKIAFNSVAVGPDSSFVVTLKDGGEVILSSKKDIGSQLSSLQLILTRLTIEGKRLNNLDFRFDKPVVAF